jgi:hypothetical protein
MPWRRAHLVASSVVTLFALLHAGLTPMLYGTWTPDAVWFLGTGLGLLTVGVLNLTHLGVEPCRQPTAKMVRWTNYLFAIFGVAGAAAVPEPQAMVLIAGLIGQALASHWTLPGPT